MKTSEPNLVAIDPGKRTGWALFRHERLKVCGYVKVIELDKIPSAPQVLIEQPRWYPHERKIDLNDLLDLSVLVGEIKENHCRRYAKVKLVFPRTWKGSVPKPIMSQRIYKTLTAEERVLLPLKRGHKVSKSALDHDHNVLDAVGLGLWKLGRLLG